MMKRIKVLVKPNAKHQKLEKISESEFRIAVKEPPQDGKANEAVIRLLAQHFKIPKMSISLLHGAKGKIKLFEIP